MDGMCLLGSPSASWVRVTTKAAMSSDNFLRYSHTIGLSTMQGRGFYYPADTAIGADGRMYTVSRSLEGDPRGARVTVYNLEGKNFQALSTRVDIPFKSGVWDGYKGKIPDWVRLRFEIYIDGRLRANSGWMGKKDGLRTLVVDNLEGAKELKLVTRYKKYPPYAVTGAWWNLRFYKKK